jgi:hypothetical protein
LWRREFEAGEESGRKVRPCVVVVAVKRGLNVTRIAVAPITHVLPSAKQIAVELPTAVKANLALDALRSWVCCDELNEFDWPGYDLAKLAGRLLLGRLPYPLFARVRAGVIEAVRHNRLKITSRD